MTYDPKLQEAMTEIEAVLKKHDVAGAITLVSRSHSEHQILFPSWSAAQGDTKGIRFESKPPTLQGRWEENQTFDESMNMVLQIRDLSAKFWNMMQGLLDVLDNEVDLKLTTFNDEIPRRLN